MQVFLSTLLLSAEMLMAAESFPVPLQAMQIQASVLAPGTSSTTLRFVIDETPTVVFDLMSPAKDLLVTLVGPNGVTIGTASAAAEGNSPFEGTGSDVPFSLAGAMHYLYRALSLTPGAYSLSVSSNGNITQDVPIIAIAVLDSTVKTALILRSNDGRPGLPVALTVAVYHGQSPASAGTVVAMIKPPNVAAFNVVLRDDGSASDENAGDGLYSGTFTPTSVGEYSIGVSISGTLPSGTTYLRHGGASLIVRPPVASLTGAVTDSSYDTDGDGIVDGIEFNIGVNVSTAGKYLAYIKLQTIRGQIISSAGELADLSAGNQTIKVRLPRAFLLRAGEDGPFHITRLDLEVFSGDAHNQTDMKRNLGSTRAYTLSDFRVPNTPPGDVNSDGIVDCQDVRLMASALGSRHGELLYDARADVNGNSTVDESDLAAVSTRLPEHSVCSR